MTLSPDERSYRALWLSECWPVVREWHPTKDDKVRAQVRNEALAASRGYSHEDADERQSSEGPYSLDVHHYAPRCVPCHKAMDLAILAAR